MASKFQMQLKTNNLSLAFKLEETLSMMLLPNVIELNTPEVGLMTSQVWKVPTSYTNKLRGGLTT